MKKSKTPKAPARLSDEAKAWWTQIVTQFEVDDDAGVLLLNTALEAFDEMRRGQEILKVDGPVITDRFGGKRQHPVTLCIWDSRNLMLRCLKQLNLDIAPGAPLGGR